MEWLIFELEEQIAPSIEGTIIDFETIGDFGNANGCERYKNIKPVIFGVLEKNIIHITYIKDEEYIPELLNLIKSKINELKPPLYAYNCEFEKCIIYYCLGLSLEFQELQPRDRMMKEVACKELGIPNYEDPFNGDGKLCLEAWWKGNYEDCVNHNRACLLKERDILNIDLYKLIMTKSSRRKDKIEGRPEWVSTTKKCEECNGEMVKTGQFSYVCASCGLVQARFKVKKRYRKKKYLNRR